MQELMSATGQDIHTIEIWDALVGLTLDQAAKLVPKALIVGVLRSTSASQHDEHDERYAVDSMRSSTGSLEGGSSSNKAASKGRLARAATALDMGGAVRRIEGWRRDSTAAVNLARYDHSGSSPGRTPSRRYLNDISRRASRGVMYVDSGASMADATGLLPGSNPQFEPQPQPQPQPQPRSRTHLSDHHHRHLSDHHHHHFHLSLFDLLIAGHCKPHSVGGRGSSPHLTIPSLTSPSAPQPPPQPQPLPQP